MSYILSAETRERFLSKINVPDSLSEDYNQCWEYSQIYQHINGGN